MRVWPVWWPAKSVSLIVSKKVTGNVFQSAVTALTSAHYAQGSMPGARPTEVDFTPCVQKSAMPALQNAPSTPLTTLVAKSVQRPAKNVQRSVNKWLLQKPDFNKAGKGTIINYALFCLGYFLTWYYPFFTKNFLIKTCSDFQSLGFTFCFDETQV